LFTSLPIKNLSCRAIRLFVYRLPAREEKDRLSLFLPLALKQRHAALALGPVADESP